LLKALSKKLTKEFGRGFSERNLEYIRKFYVLIDLKIGTLTHQDLGQMQMYVNYFDRYVKTKEEHSTVGIILCRKNRETIVEITLPKDANIHAKEYQLYLLSKVELKKKLIEWTKF
jgi:hypothetical protein